MSKAKRINNNDRFDVVVIGAGPAGLMAAFTAVESGARIIVVEKNDSPGKKLLMTGNSRCNFTHNETDIQKLIDSYGDKGSFLYSAFSLFGVQDTIDFFNKHGVESKAEKDGRVFPRSNRAADILNVFVNRLKGSNSRLLINSEVRELTIKRDKLKSIILNNNTEIFADRFILCTGGRSYPSTGSTGDGYRWAKNLGHKIIPPKPALTPIKIREKWVKNLQGLSMPGVLVSLYNGEKESIHGTGDIIFTHFGISGPLILNMSRYLTQSIKKGEIKIRIDLKPEMNFEQLSNHFRELFKNNLVKPIVAVLRELFPNRLACEILNLTEVNPEKKVNQVNRDEREKILKLVKRLEITPSGLCDFNYAMTTSGGVDLAEVSPKTMGSRLVENLFFAGEILDLDGPTGGYNLQICWSTGYLAGSK